MFEITWFELYHSHQGSRGRLRRMCVFANAVEQLWQSIAWCKTKNKLYLYIISFWIVRCHLFKISGVVSTLFINRPWRTNRCATCSHSAIMKTFVCWRRRRSLQHSVLADAIAARNTCIIFAWFAISLKNEWKSVNSLNTFEKFDDLRVFLMTNNITACVCKQATYIFFVSWRLPALGIRSARRGRRG